MHDDRSFLGALTADGRPLLVKAGRLEANAHAIS
jgi:hypothetical protein